MSLIFWIDFLFRFKFFFLIGDVVVDFLLINFKGVLNSRLVFVLVYVVIIEMGEELGGLLLSW